MMKFFIYFLLIYVSIFKGTAQKINLKILFVNSTDKINKETIINIFQEDTIIKTSINSEFQIKKAVKCNIEFINKSKKIPGFKNLIIFNDTILFVNSNILEDVVVTSKKSIVKETLAGFDYFPQNDSIFKNKPLLYALQRLPWITVNDLSIQYKNGEKILFQINGKYRRGIGNNWNELLKSIKAKDIYKVELIDDITMLAKKQGYKVIINILTLNENIYGSSFNAALLYDQRNNLNRTLDATLLRKKMDFSFSYGSRDDNMIGKTSVEVLKNKIIIENHKFLEVTKSVNDNINLGVGIRLDSFNDLSLNINYNVGNFKNIFIKNYNFPAAVSNLNNINKEASLNVNFSYTNFKIKNTIKSFSISNNTENLSIDNKRGFLMNKSYDSINKIINTKPIYWVFDYNVQLKKTKTLSLEYGIQMYAKKVVQGIGVYTLNEITNKNEIVLVNKKDSFTTIQNSLNPYLRIRKELSKTRSISLRLNSEIYQLRNLGFQKQSFFLPQARMNFKKIVNKITSIDFNTSFNYYKPNNSFLNPIVLSINPLKNYLGNVYLIPQKIVSLGFNVNQNRKIFISNSLSLSYGYDLINSFEKYNELTKLIETNVDNSGKSFNIGINNYISTLLFKKINASLSFNVNYSNSRSSKNNSKYSGYTFGSSSNINYDISKKLGNIGFMSILNSNSYTNQGYSQGLIKYFINYSKVFFNGKLVFSFSASQFLLKNRTVKSYSFFNDIENISETTKPFRIISTRLAYNFSNIKVRKYAASKTASIYGEANK